MLLPVFRRSFFEYLITEGILQQRKEGNHEKVTRLRVYYRGLNSYLYFFGGFLIRIVV